MAEVSFWIARQSRSHDLEGFPRRHENRRRRPDRPLFDKILVSEVLDQLSESLRASAAISQREEPRLSIATLESDRPYPRHDLQEPRRVLGLVAKSHESIADSDGQVFAANLRKPCIGQIRIGALIVTLG